MTPIQELQKNIEILEAWKVSKEKQQVSYPLDIQSVNNRQTAFNKPKNVTFKIVTDGILIQNNPTLYEPFLVTDLFALGLGIKWKNEERYVYAMRSPVYVFSVVSTVTDVFTSTHPLQNGDVIYVATAPSDSLPTGLNETTAYTVTNATATTFKLSGVDITSNGSGTLYFHPSI